MNQTYVHQTRIYGAYIKNLLLNYYQIGVQQSNIFYINQTIVDQ